MGNASGGARGTPDDRPTQLSSLILAYKIGWYADEAARMYRVFIPRPDGTTYELSVPSRDRTWQSAVMIAIAAYQKEETGGSYRGKTR